MSHFFTYNGRRSTDYGVTISGGGTYAAPARDMTEVVIPGKNGHMLLDNGRFENITVTYPGWIARGFDGKIDAFRAFLASDPGYKRLEDTYHPGEFRLAAFRSGFDPDTGPLNRSGRFDIVFDCLPERWLKSGEIWTKPAMPVGHVAVANPGGGSAVNDGYRATPYLTAETTVTVKLICTPGPNHALSELTSLMVDDDYYALYYQKYGASGSTSTMLPSLVSNGYFSTSVTGHGFVKFYYKAVDGFDWSVDIDGTEYPLGGEIEIVNPTRYEAKPLIRMDFDLTTITTASMAYRTVFTLNGTTVFIDKDCDQPTVYFDCELGDCYALDGSGNAINCNEFLTMKNSAGTVVHEYPKLLPGKNELEFTGSSWLLNISASTIALKPRWWTL